MNFLRDLGWKYKQKNFRICKHVYAFLQVTVQSRDDEAVPSNTILLMVKSSGADAALNSCQMIAIDYGYTLTWYSSLLELLIKQDIIQYCDQSFVRNKPLQGIVVLHALTG